MISCLDGGMAFKLALEVTDSLLRAAYLLPLLVSAGPQSEDCMFHLHQARLANRLASITVATIVSSYTSSTIHFTFVVQTGVSSKTSSLKLLTLATKYSPRHKCTYVFKH